jgi:hypothetical protein
VHAPVPKELNSKYKPAEAPQGEPVGAGAD